MLQLAAKVDPELIRQMREVSVPNSPVEAVFRLNSENPDEPTNPPERTLEIAKEVLNRVKERLGIEPHRVNVFRNLGSFAVAAEPRFLNELIAEPEIASAMANRRAISGYIPPINKRPASISEIGNENTRRTDSARKSAAKRRSRLK